MIIEIVKVIVIGNMEANESESAIGSMKVRVIKIAEKSITIIKINEMITLVTRMMARRNRKHHQAIQIPRVHHHQHRRHLLRNNQATTVAHPLRLRKGVNMSMIDVKTVTNVVIAEQGVGAVAVVAVSVVITIANVAAVIATRAQRMTTTGEVVIHLRDMVRRGNIRVPVHVQHTHLHPIGVDINSMSLECSLFFFVEKKCIILFRLLYFYIIIFILI